MRKGGSSRKRSNSRHAAGVGGIGNVSVRNGELMQRKDSERSVIRTHALDRQHLNSTRRGLTKGTTPLKTRYIPTTDLSIFSCSNSHYSGTMRRSKRRSKHKQPKQDLLQLKLQKQHFSMNNSGVLHAQAPRSSRSHRSERSAKRSLSR